MSSTYSRSKRGRFVTILLDLADSGMVLELTNLHLSHKYETTRMREMSEIKATLEWWRAKQPEGSRNEEKMSVTILFFSVIRYDTFYWLFIQSQDMDR